MSRHKGIVKLFDERFGCGLITSAVGDDILLNKKSISAGHKLSTGRIVTFLFEAKSRYAYKIVVEQ
ncbi:cold-shock protein [Pedobacter yonginense]|uniref:Cold-shock protein n=1 Tax=Pedobacter yonginense TaxID=651869 RepID=A0A317ERM6_9SPHI|nr:cold-shock protein [Pedobacter yonginense]PWS28757.1 cold-shock protein [Pedobacter yonginense]